MSNKLRKLAGLISPRLAGNSTCEACGEEFSCGAGLKGCWCSEIELNQEVSANLKSQYRDCLCRTCLERINAETRPSGLVRTNHPL